MTFLYRTRLAAIRRQAAADGQAIDAWHLATLHEGLPFHKDVALPIIDRGAIFAAARRASTLHPRLVAPDLDEEGEVQQAEKGLAGQCGVTPLIAAAQAIRTWIDAGDARPGPLLGQGAHPADCRGADGCRWLPG